MEDVAKDVSPLALVDSDERTVIVVLGVLVIEKALNVVERASTVDVWFVSTPELLVDVSCVVN